MSQTRSELGFLRTSCDCSLCQLFCRHYPAFLIPADLERLIPASADPFAWAREHLRARVAERSRRGKTRLVAEMLLPATTKEGGCHWYVGQHCAVHANSPFGCAFFDQHQSEREAMLRAEKAAEVIRQAMVDKNSLYRRLCDYLLKEGLIIHLDDIVKAEAAVHRELTRIQRNEAGKRRKNRARPKHHHEK